ncbi:hypothetical protein [Gimesia sp.]|uniref:hypothetical protein n=1 Tax=Gimesia sp. TaxID=2024833 RepID=UPI003A95371E
MAHFIPLPADGNRGCLYYHKVAVRLPVEPDKVPDQCQGTVIRIDQWQSTANVGFQ